MNRLLLAGMVGSVLVAVAAKPVSANSAEQAQALVERAVRRSSRASVTGMVTMRHVRHAGSLTRHAGLAP